MFLFLSPSVDLLFFIIYLCKKACWQQFFFPISAFCILGLTEISLEIQMPDSQCWMLTPSSNSESPFGSFPVLLYSKTCTQCLLSHLMEVPAVSPCPDKILSCFPSFRLNFCRTSCIALNTAGLKSEPERDPALSFLTELQMPQHK